VHVLGQWRAGREEELRALLRYFVLVTKQQARAHVILSTSDPAFVSWLQQGDLSIFHSFPP
jgi:hypothetical protein